jgi:hypothetical protein
MARPAEVDALTVGSLRTRRWLAAFVSGHGAIVVGVAGDVMRRMSRSGMKPLSSSSVWYR